MDDQVTAFFGVVRGLVAQLSANSVTRVRWDKRRFTNRAFSTALLGRLMAYVEGALATPIVISRVPPMNDGRLSSAYYSALEPHHIWIDDGTEAMERLYLMAHEASHAIVSPHLIGDTAGAGPWFVDHHVRRTYDVGEVVAETAAFLATRPYITLTNGIAPVYVASYVAHAQHPEALLARAFPHTVATAQTLHDVLERV